MSTFRMLPFAAVLLAGGCVSDYGYYGGRHDAGDYYVGTPRVAYGAYSGYTPYIDPGLYGYGYGWHGWYRGNAYPGPYPYPGGHPYWSVAYRGGPWGGGSYWGGYRLYDPYWGNPYWRTTYWGGAYRGGPSYGAPWYGGPWYGGPYDRRHRHPGVQPPPNPPVAPPAYIHRMNPRDGVIPPRVVRPAPTQVRPPPRATTPPPVSPPPPSRPTPVAPTSPPTPSGPGPRKRAGVKTVDPRAD